MQNKSSLLGGVALGVVLAVTFGSAAQAKAHHHHAGGANPALQSEVETLSNAVSDLEGRLNDETAAERATQAEADAAKADAAEARAEAAAAQGQLAQQIQTIPGVVNSAVAANKPKPSWADNTTVGGTVFANFSYINQTPNPTPALANNILNKDENGIGVDLKRFYISVDHKFNDIFSANVTTDVTYDNATIKVAQGSLPSNTPVNTCSAGFCNVVTGDKVTQLYVKKAFMQAKLSDALIFRVGASDLPWVPFEEGLYGYRYVENVMIDRTKYGSSTDWGVHMFGAVPVSPDVTLNYAISGVNGLGYKVPGIGTANRSEAMDVEGRVSATIDKKVTVAVGGYVGKLGQAVQGVATPNLAERFDALVAYVDPTIRAGVEYFWADNDTASAVTTVGNQRSQGVSVFGSYNVTPKVALFGRYDWVQPRQDLSSSYTDNYFNLGVSYEPVKVVDLALVWKHETVNNDPGQTFATSNFGSLPASAAGNGTYDEVGVWTQLKW